MADKVETPKIEEMEAKIEKGEKLTPAEETLLQGTGPDDQVTKDKDEEVDPEEMKVEKLPDEKKSGKKASDTPDEKDSEAAKENEKEAADAATKEAERKKMIEKDSEKPLDEVDIKDYSPTERALFFELRKERRKRQDSQTEADTLKFQKAKEDARKQLEREREEAEAKAQEEADSDPFKDLEDDDLLTAGQIKKILAGHKPAKETPAQAEDRERLNKLQSENWLYKARERATDLNSVLPFADELLMNDKDAHAEVEDVVKRGGNPFLATYNLIKAHPRWPEIEAKIRGDKSDAGKEEDDARTNKDRADRIEANKRKPVTTGSGGGTATSGDYSIQELLDMPDEQFGRLPKAQRDKILLLTRLQKILFERGNTTWQTHRV
jgi:hypothetical protein